jgi:transcription antitermination protein NusB
MVNRRLLRVKAFQQMYAYWTQERAQHQLAFDELTYIFLPDLSLMIAKEEQMPRLEGLRKLAEIQLTEFFQEIPTEETIPEESLKQLNRFTKNTKSIRKRSLKNLKKIWFQR